jgi:hypothetical protein
MRLPFLHAAAARNEYWYLLAPHTRMLCYTVDCFSQANPRFTALSISIFFILHKLVVIFWFQVLVRPQNSKFWGIWWPLQLLLTIFLVIFSEITIMVYLLIENAFDGVEVVLNFSNVCVDAIAGQCLPFTDFANLMGLHFHNLYFVF